MKIQNMKKKGKRGLRAILCLLLSFMCIAVMDISARAEVSMTDYPSVYLSPDGSEWTTYDELPYCENYHVADFALDYKFPFWTEGGKIIETGEISRKTDPSVGQHRYNFERRGEVPVLYC